MGVAVPITISRTVIACHAMPVAIIARELVLAVAILAVRTITGILLSVLPNVRMGLQLILRLEIVDVM